MDKDEQRLFDERGDRLEEYRNQTKLLKTEGRIEELRSLAKVFSVSLCEDWKNTALADFFIRRAEVIEREMNRNGI